VGEILPVEVVDGDVDILGRGKTADRGATRYLGGELGQ
jgi:hypothetical protein